MPEEAYAHIIVDPNYFGGFYFRKGSPYKIVAKFQGIDDTSFLVQGPQDDIKRLCESYPGSHLVESLTLSLFYESRRRKEKIQKEMSPIGSLLLLNDLTSPKIDPWEFLKNEYLDRYTQHLARKFSFSRGFYDELVLPEYDPSFSVRISDGVHTFRPDEIILP